MAPNCEISIIFTVKNAGIDLYMTMESLKVTRSLLPYEVIIVNEGSVDGCCDFLMYYNFPMKIKVLKGHSDLPSRNIAAAHASGQVLVFCSASLYFEDEWLESLTGRVLNGETDAQSPLVTIQEHAGISKELPEDGGILESVLHYPLTTGGGDELCWLSADCWAVSHKRFLELGGVEEGFQSKGLETAEFSMRLWLSGGSCKLQRELTLTAVYRHHFPCEIEAACWGEDLLMLSHLHFSDENIERCKKLVLHLSGPDALVNENEIARRTASSRHKYASRRKREDSWFFKRFSVGV